MTMGELPQRPEINFVHGDVTAWEDVAGPEGRRFGLDEIAPRIRMGREIWIVQAFHQLRERGWPVRLTGEMEPQAINILHSDDLTPQPDLWRHFIVSVRADRDPSFISQMEIVQNQTSIWSESDIHIPHWPQPGLIPRALDRGHRMENVVYMGNLHQLDAAFQSQRFEEELESQGMTLKLQGDRWWDYSEADLVLAVRDGSPLYRSIKPASKLVNAWQAGCPAILSPEAAYREVRQSALDFVEASSPESVIQAIFELKHDPRRVQAMVDNGRERCREFQRDRITDRWVQALEDRIIPRFTTWSRTRERRPVRLRSVYLTNQLRRQAWGTRVVEAKQPLWKEHVGWIRRAVTLPRSARIGTSDLPAFPA